MNPLFLVECPECRVRHYESPEDGCACRMCDGCGRAYPPALASFDYPEQECLSCMDLGRAGAPRDEFPAEREAAERER